MDEPDTTIPEPPETQIKEGDGVTEINLEQPEQQLPEGAVETPQEQQEEKPKVSFDDFEKEMGFPSTKEEPIATKPPMETPPAPVSKQVAFEARDYTGLKPHEVVFAKKMAKDSFAHYKSVLSENNALKAEKTDLSNKLVALSQGKAQLPDSYYDHEGSVTLTPEYNEIYQAVTLASQVQNHWQQQLANVRAGEQWNNLEMHNNQLQQSQPIEATPQGEAYIMSQLSFSQQQVLAQENRAKQLIEGHKSKVAQRTDLTRAIEKEYYPHFENEQFVGVPMMRDISKKMEGLGFRGNPLLQAFAKSAATNQLLIAYIKSKLGQATAVAGTARDARQAQPRIPQSALGANGKPNVSFDMYEKVKQGLL